MSETRTLALAFRGDLMKDRSLINAETKTLGGSLGGSCWAGSAPGDTAPSEP